MYTDKKVNLNKALSVMSVLFFMWGLITVLNIALTDQLSTVFRLTPFQALFIHVAFYSTYFIAGYPSGKVIDKIGFRKGLLAGALLAAAGCFLFYPAAGFRSFPLFIMALVVVATGFTLLQTAANPYVLLVGERQTSASRLSLIGAFNSLGTFLAPLLAAGVFYNIAGYNPDDFGLLSPSEIDSAIVNYVQVPYLILGALWLLIGALVYFANLPSIQTANVEPNIKSDKPITNELQVKHFVLGMIAIFAYVGAEVAIGQFIYRQDPGFSQHYWGLAMIGRFIGAAALIKLSPRKLVMVNTLGAILMLVVYLIFNGGEHTILFLVLIGLFNSILWPCVFMLSIDGLGKFTEEGSSYLIMMILGGAVIPLLFMNIVTIPSIGAGFAILLVCYAYIFYFGLKGSRYEKRTNLY
ncbi:MAG: fucP [Cytophagaceae bacterium]|jgi:FHS family L-fucose permease-like MFS transporter|nr:fucP [Cytophagaceae bacterium]